METSRIKRKNFEYGRKDHFRFCTVRRLISEKYDLRLISKYHKSELDHWSRNLKTNALHHRATIGCDPGKLVGMGSLYPFDNLKQIDNFPHHQEFGISALKHSKMHTAMTLFCTFSKGGVTIN